MRNRKSRNLWCKEAVGETTTKVTEIQWKRFFVFQMVEKLLFSLQLKFVPFSIKHLFYERVFKLHLGNVIFIRNSNIKVNLPSKKELD